MPAKKPTAYRVSGALAIVRMDGTERYLYRGAEFDADSIDAAHAEHLLGAGLIESVVEPPKPKAKQKEPDAEPAAE